MPNFNRKTLAHKPPTPTWVYGKKTRLTAKPVQLPTTTGVLRMRLPNSRVSRMTCKGEGPWWGCCKFASTLR